MKKVYEDREKIVKVFINMVKNEWEEMGGRDGGEIVI